MNTHLTIHRDRMACSWTECTMTKVCDRSCVTEGCKKVGHSECYERFFLRTPGRLPDMEKLDYLCKECADTHFIMNIIVKTKSIEKRITTLEREMGLELESLSKLKGLVPRTKDLYDALGPPHEYGRVGSGLRKNVKHLEELVFGIYD
jgi:hypothetical protein